MGESPLAFPYGYIMWLALLPLTVLAKLVNLPILYGYQLTLLFADFCLLLTLQRLLPKQQRLVLISYWLSPIVIIASYCLGLNDLIPTLLLMIALLCIHRAKFKWAGLIYGMAISAKLSMIVALPFILIYLLNNRSRRQYLAGFMVNFAASIIIFQLPVLCSAAGIQMLLGNPQIGRIYQLAISLTGNINIYVVPLVYLIMLYVTWQLRRLNFDLFQTIIGIVFMLLVLLTPASPGWVIWSMPFLVIYQVRNGLTAIVLVNIFAWLYVLSTIALTILPITHNHTTAMLGILANNYQPNSNIISILYTMMLAIGIILALRMWREAISKNDFFRCSRKPFVVGIAGDSGSGKDTLAKALAGIFGHHSVVRISGDDYHLWERHKPMWQVITPLNPLANDLEKFCKDLLLLKDGLSIIARHYDHSTGKISKPFTVKSKDFIIASGLHTLYLPALRDCYNLKIYLDIDESLRYALKINRDVKQRGHHIEQVLDSLAKRAPDSTKFIQPQLQHADLIFTLKPIDNLIINGTESAPPVNLKLITLTHNSLNELSIRRVLVGVCGLKVDLVLGNNSNQVQLTIEGDVSADDIAMAAEILYPRIHDFLAMQPQWQDGMLGLMQLITLSHISQAMTKSSMQ
jgi:uridine kinase